jgi:hypothetical protein
LAGTLQEARVTHLKTRQWLFVSAAVLWSHLVLAGELPPPLAPEVSDVAMLPPPSPHRFVAVGRSGSTIFDGDTGKIQGSIPSGYIANVAIAPDDSRFYVAETYWTHGARGTRDDLVTIYDGKTLNLIKEIALPGRALVGKMQNFDLNAAGTRAYIYILSPAGAVTWVDLKKQKVGGTVEIPGCALVFPWGDAGFSSLCGDGSLASVVVPDSGKPTVTHTKPFFDANADPIFDAGCVDRATGTAIFISYTGLNLSSQARQRYRGRETLVDRRGGWLPAGRHGGARTRVASRRLTTRGLPQGDRQVIRLNAPWQLLDAQAGWHRGVGARYEDPCTDLAISVARQPDEWSRRRCGAVLCQPRGFAG